MNSGRAVSWSLNRRSKWDLKIKQKKNKKHQKMRTTQNQTLLSAERSLFGQKKAKYVFLMALGCWLFCGQRPVMTTAKNNTTKQGVLLFFCCVFLVVVAPTTTKQQTNKQQPSEQEQATTTKQQSWDPEFKRTKDQTHSKKRQQHQTQRGKTP